MQIWRHSAKREALRAFLPTKLGMDAAETALFEETIRDETEREGLLEIVHHEGVPLSPASQPQPVEQECALVTRVSGC